jgi:hypothetical protein
MNNQILSAIERWIVEKKTQPQVDIAEGYYIGVGDTLGSLEVLMMNLRRFYDRRKD